MPTLFVELKIHFEDFLKQSISLKSYAGETTLNLSGLKIKDCFLVHAINHEFIGSGSPRKGDLMIEGQKALF